MNVHSDIGIFSSCSAADDMVALLQRCSEHLRGFEAYVVGGFVRDALLGQTSRDIDIVIVNNALAAAHHLASVLGGTLVCHEQFCTATLTLPSGFALDVVQARRESYPYPGALPQIESGTLEDDLRRRDFRANSLAACLESSRFGNLVDAGGGYEDLRQGVVRIWHECSFIDDPTRIFRALKYALRCGWQLDSWTQSALRDAVSSGALATVSAARVHHEFALIFAEVKAPQILLALLQEGVLEALACPLGVAPALVSQRLHCLATKPNLEWPNLSLMSVSERAQLYINIVLSNAELEQGRDWLQQWAFPAEQKKQYERYKKVHAEWQRAVVGASGGARWCVLPADEIILASLYWGSVSPSQAAELAWYQRHWQAVPPLLTGQDLRRLGVQPGPQFGELLRQLRIAQLEGRVGNKAEAEAWTLRALAEVALEPKAGC